MVQCTHSVDHVICPTVACLPDLPSGEHAIVPLKCEHACDDTALFLPPMPRRYNQISVNIMLDACSYARNLRVARTILAKLERARFKIDLRNWNTWVECLCRANRFDEALDVVLVKIRQSGCEPDLQCVRVLLKFAKRLPKEQGDEICLQIEKELPHLWKRLPKELRNR